MTVARSGRAVALTEILGSVRLSNPLLGLAAAVTTLVLMVGAVELLAEWIAADDIKDRAMAAEDVGRARTMVLAVLAGGLAAVGAYYTHRGFQLSRQGQITERFTRAVDQLGNTESMDVRLGGVYALERVARESADDHGPIIDILAAFVRSRAPIPSEDELARMYTDYADMYPQPPKPDVQAALTVIGRRVTAYDPPPPWRLDLSGSYLPMASLRSADLARADLSFSHLTGAALVNADMRKARLFRADVIDADFSSARLDSADLTHARALRARFNGASFKGAELDHTRLGRADLSDATGLAEARVVDPQYDDATKWPRGFEPPDNSAD